MLAGFPESNRDLTLSLGVIRRPVIRLPVSCCLATASFAFKSAI